MNNDRLSMEEARERIAQRRRKAKMYGPDQRPEYNDEGVAPMFFAFIIIVVVILAIGVLL
jgi:hypothetical protein